jgi:hypothetical protein
MLEMVPSDMKMVLIVVMVPSRRRCDRNPAVLHSARVAMPFSFTIAPQYRSMEHGDDDVEINGARVALR